MPRFISVSLALLVAAASSACISISPDMKDPNRHATELARMSEQAVKTCGEGKVKEVSAKSFSCQ